MGEIGGAVKRVHVPAEGRIAFRAASFLRDNRMLRKTSAQAGHNGLFCAAIGLRDDVDFALVADFDRAGKLLNKNAARIKGSFGSDFEKLISATHMPMFGPSFGSMGFSPCSVVLVNRQNRTG